VTFVVKHTSWWILALAALAIGAGCGKRGAPLAPILRIPAPVDKIQSQRAGSDVFITLTVPATNIDASIPVDIARIEVYGYTGRTAPPRTRWAELGDLVATIPVVRPPLDGTVAAGTAVAGTTVAGTPPEQTVPAGPTPGMVVTVFDKLTREKLVQGRIDPPVAPGRGRVPVAPSVTAPESDVLRRYYVAFPFSVRGRPGPAGAAAEFPLVDAPEPPPFVLTPYTETTVIVQWAPSGGLIGFLFDRPLGPEDPPLDSDFEPVVTASSPLPGASTSNVMPTGPSRYNVYRQIAPDPLAPPDENTATPWNASSPAPLNPVPLDVMTFSDALEFDRERCYVVRAVRGVAPNIVEGDASEPACVAPTDIFPPAPPARVVAVTDGGGVSLIWEPNAEPDLAGYLVLRGEASDATLQPLTPTPIVEPRFRDTQVTAGKKYVYAVVAVDSHLPVPNVSAESARVEETAR
jgi:hypothetical protein